MVADRYVRDLGAVEAGLHTSTEGFKVGFEDMMYQEQTET